MSELWAQDWFRWSLGLIFAFPVLVVVLGEVSSWLARRGNALAEPVATVRNAVLPVLALQVFLFNVLDLGYTGTFGKLFVTALWLVAIYAALNFLNALLFEQAARDTWRANVPTLFRDLSRFILVLIGFAVIFSTVWDANLSSLITALGVGSLVIGLALQDTLGNLFAGIAILFEKPYSEGDWIRVDDTLGKVAAVNWRATRIVTRDGDTVVIPNSVVASSKVLNESRSLGAGYEDYFLGFSYDDPPNQVKRVLLDLIRTTAGVLTEPPPMVRTISYDDSSISYQVRFAVGDFSSLPSVKDAFATRVWYAAKRHGLTIPFPIRTVYTFDGRAGAEAEAETALQESVTQVTATLAPLEREDALETGVVLHHFGAGETVLWEGDRADTLYTILSGEVCMRLSNGATYQQITCLSKGDIFGASSLLRGEPSAASFVALGDATLVALSKDAVLRMVRRKTSFARELEEVIESREQAAKTARESLLERPL